MMNTIVLAVLGVVLASNSGALAHQPVLFQAGNPSDLSLVKDQDIIFTKVVLNEGNGYNAATGRFTCTFPGIYAFSLQHCADTAKYSHVTIVKNGVRLMAGVAYGAKWSPCATVQAYVRLQAGDQVWAKATWESYLFNNLERTTSFSGVLVDY